ncbi:hypothetical protein DD581_33995 [Klebsiella pneumoniae]|nr:hypothetical protein DD581_33995 [Klebsiella pneumoniae]
MISTLHIKDKIQESKDLMKAQQVFLDLYCDATDELDEHSATSEDSGSEKEHTRAKLLLKGGEEKFFDFPNQKSRRQKWYRRKRDTEIVKYDLCHQSPLKHNS